MNVYERAKLLCKSKGVSIAKMERELGLARSAASKWQKFDPNSATVAKLADYFNVSQEYILTGEEPEGYYADNEIAKIAQQVYERPDLRMLFDATYNVSDSDLRIVVEMVKRMKGNEE